jgi:LysR family glycine cleavage system transcriptional activator
MQKLPPLNAIRAFYVASRLKSFTKAATKLHVTQGAVSRQIKLLEDWVGMPLFLRQHHELVLTSAGISFAASVATAFAQLEEGVRNLQPSRLRQRLLVNVPTTFASRWLAPRLQEFHRRYEHLDLSITTNVVTSPAQAQQYDCCIVFQNAPWHHGDSSVLHLEEHVVVASPTLADARGRLQRGEAILLHLLNNDGTRLQVWENWYATSGEPLRHAQSGITFSTLDQAIHAAVAGAGIALVDLLMVQKELDSGLLVQLADRALKGPFGYWLVQSDRRPLESPEHGLAAQQLHEWLRGSID